MTNVTNTTLDTETRVAAAHDRAADAIETTNNNQETTR